MKRAKLTEDQVLEIVNTYNEEHPPIQEIADRYGVGKTTINSILSGLSWKEITEGLIEPRIGQRGTIQSRFWSKVDKTETCRVWTGYTARYGYFAWNRDGINNIVAHRASWILQFGEIPDGMNVLHKCDNPPCVRPDHLFLGTQADNVKDMLEKERQCRSEAKPCNVLSKEDIFAILDRYENTPSLIKEIAEDYNVSATTISLILGGKKWKEVTMGKKTLKKEDQRLNDTST